MNKNLKIAILDDHPIILDGLNAFLQGCFPSFVIRTFSNIDLFKSHLNTEKTDILILDLRIQTVDNSIELIKYLKIAWPDIKLIVFTSFVNSSYVNECVELGINSYISKDSPIVNIKKAIEAVVMGNNYYDEEISSLIIKKTINPVKGQKKDLLSKREMEIVFFLSLGMNSTLIAEKLCISKNTVRTHRQNILEKTGCTTKYELIQYVQKHYNFGA